MTLDELAAQVAELSESMAAVKAQMAVNAQLGVQIRELLEVLR